MKKINLVALVLLSVSAFSDTLLHVGNLIDVESGEMAKAMTVTIAGNEIKSVTKGYAKPKKK